jgi:hypothetical protein
MWRQQKGVQFDVFACVADVAAPPGCCKANFDTGGEFENERKAGFPQGADALKSGNFLSPLMQLICCQPHRGEFATSHHDWRSPPRMKMWYNAGYAAGPEVV